MNSPFQFGKIVEGAAFTNRVKEISRLISNFESTLNTILISPRRWGKSSLVKKAATEALKKHKNYRFCFIDLFNIRNEHEFYTEFSTEIIKVTSGKVKEMVENAKSFLSRISYRLNVGPDPMNDFKIAFDMRDIKENTYNDVLKLPEKIAAKKNITLIVCIDEFQNLSNFEDPLLFQKRLRTAWQYHQKTTYCLYGSKRHMLMHLFENKSMPFYKFGDVFYLNKLDKENLQSFIIERFKKTNKKIELNEAGKIIDLMQCHPYYVQQLAHLAWINTQYKVNDNILRKAVDELLSQNSLLFEKEVESLSNTQVSFLKALTAGVKKDFSSAAIIEKYNLRSSANVSKIIDALENKEIIDTVGSKIEFIDPAFELWLKDNYFI